MKPSEMLHQMCDKLLAGSDVKTLCAVRGFPREAASSRGILETLFLSPQGLSKVFETFNAEEIAVLHLLKSPSSPVDITFFSRIYGTKHKRYGTFTQRFKECFAEVKQRLVRNGVLLWAEEPERPWQKSSKMERWRFAFPKEFHDHLPPLIESPGQFEGDGHWRSNVVRDQLIADLSSRRRAGKAAFQIEAGELRLDGKPFRKAELARWLKEAWSKAIRKNKEPNPQDRHSRQPHEAVLRILSELPAGHWASAEQLSGPLQVFCERKADADAVCHAGWEWGLLARQRHDGKHWYRPAPEPPRVPPHQYLTEDEPQGRVIADLRTIPLDVLEQLVTISDVAAAPGGTPLLLTPNFVKLGRADDELLASEPHQWLIKKTSAFAEAHARLSKRRGKTILHENLCIAKVSDLSLKVALEKALGNKLVSLKNDYVAFPHGLLYDVRRHVQNSGHVVKEVAAK